MSGDSATVSSRKPASTSTDSGEGTMDALVAALNRLLADLFALYIKTKNFHWRMNGRHFRDYIRLLDEQSSQILGTIDPLAERVRQLGADTLHSIGEVSRQQRIRDNDSSFVSADDMLIELLGDNQALARAL